MNGRAALLVGVCLVVATLVGSWWFAGEAGAPAGLPAANAVAVPAPSAAPASAAVPATDAPVAASAPANEVERAAAPAATPAAARATATVRGRCVDAGGRPLAGCTVDLSGWGANQERTDAWLLEHGAEPEWQDPAAIVTGADGAFAFTFWPPPPFQFALDVGKDGCGALGGRWAQLDAGSTTDVGDVVVTGGIQVTGRVVDADGRPQPKQYVTLQRRDEPGGARRSPFGAVAPRWGDQVRTRDDGTFATRGWLVPGRYEVSAQGRRLASPPTLELTVDRPVEDITVVVATEADVPTITGRVVDEAGQPVRGAEIEDRSVMRGPMGDARSARDGTFVLKQPAGATAESASLVVWADGYDCPREPRQVSWGSRDVELRVARGGVLTLRVSDAGGAPVETYAVRLIPRNRGRFSSDDARVRAKGPHADGVATIAGLTKGDWLVIVDFPAATGFPSVFEPLQQPDNGPRRLDLRAGGAARRTLRVVDPDGAPIAGSQVQLCELFGAPFPESRMVMRREQWMWNVGGDHALIVFDGATDADGRLELLGPGGRELGLELLGPGHLPARQSGVQLDVPGELVVRTSRGARLVGRIVPAAAVAELHRLAGSGDGQAFGADRRPALGLRAADGRRFPANAFASSPLARLSVADDGSFDADGLPPGPWQVQVTAWQVHDSGASSRDFGAQQVVLVDGRTTSVELDLAPIVPGSVDATVTLNGAPLADAIVSLQAANEWINVRTDAAGHFAAVVRPGDYTLLVQRPIDRESRPMLRCLSPVRVVRGETTRQTFAVASGTLLLTVLDPDGAPAAGVQLVLRPDGDFLPPTDAAGRVAVEVTAQNATLQTLPQRLASPAAQQALWREAQAAGVQDPLAPHWLAVATIGVQQGQTNAHEIRLPPAWRE